jgi:hypothetical protein
MTASLFAFPRSKAGLYFSSTLLENPISYYTRNHSFFSLQFKVDTKPEGY